MAIELRVEPRRVVTWEPFSKDWPHFSIALDGYCSGPTRSSIGGLCLNLNHHEGEDPIAVLVRTLNDLLRPHGWTSEMRMAARSLNGLSRLLKFVPRFLPKNGALVRQLIDADRALQTLAPLLVILGSDSSTRFRLPSAGDSASRMSIRSTTAQALCQIKLGLYDTYQVNGEPTALLWVNDCDEDVVFATYMLMHPETVDNKRFRELASLEDYLDMSAGLFPVKKREHVVRRLCWITEPYAKARLSGRLFSMDAETMKALILEMHDRITATLHGHSQHGQEIEPDTRYEVLFDHGTWKMVREIGAQARLGLAEDGVKAFISVRSEVPGAYRYTYARLSQFVPFPIVAFCEHLNDLEGIGPENPDRHGGSDTVGGPPREAGTRLSPEELDGIAVAFLERHNLQKRF